MKAVWDENRLRSHVGALPSEHIEVLSLHDPEMGVQVWICAYHDEPLHPNGLAHYQLVDMPASRLSDFAWTQAADTAVSDTLHQVVARLRSSPPLAVPPIDAAAYLLA